MAIGLVCCFGLMIWLGLFVKFDWAFDLMLVCVCWFAFGVIWLAW